MLLLHQRGRMPLLRRLQSTEADVVEGGGEFVFRFALPLLQHYFAAKHLGDLLVSFQVSQPTPHPLPYGTGRVACGVANHRRCDTPSVARTSSLQGAPTRSSSFSTRV